MNILLRITLNGKKGIMPNSLIIIIYVKVCQNSLKYEESSDLALGNRFHWFFSALRVGNLHCIT